MAQALGRSIFSEAIDWPGLRSAVCDAVLRHFDDGKALFRASTPKKRCRCVRGGGTNGAMRAVNSSGVRCNCHRQAVRNGEGPRHAACGMRGPRRSLCLALIAAAFKWAAMIWRCQTSHMPAGMKNFGALLLSRKTRVLIQRQQPKTGPIFCRWWCNSAKGSVSSA